MLAACPPPHPKKTNVAFLRALIAATCASSVTLAAGAPASITGGAALHVGGAAAAAVVFEEEDREEEEVMLVSRHESGNCDGGLLSMATRENAIPAAIKRPVSAPRSSASAGEDVVCCLLASKSASCIVAASVCVAEVAACNLPCGAGA